MWVDSRWSERSWWGQDKSLLYPLPLLEVGVVYFDAIEGVNHVRRQDGDCPETRQ